MFHHLTSLISWVFNASNTQCLQIQFGQYNLPLKNPWHQVIPLKNTPWRKWDDVKSHFISPISDLMGHPLLFTTNERSEQKSQPLSRNSIYITLNSKQLQGGIYTSHPWLKIQPKTAIFIAIKIPTMSPWISKNHTSTLIDHLKLDVFPLISRCYTQKKSQRKIKFNSD